MTECSHITLLRRLEKETRVLRSPRLAQTFRVVDRKYFVPEELQEEAYEDYPLPIDYGQTISQPTTVAFLLDKLDVHPGQKALDVGSGSGWTTALLSCLAGPTGNVIGVEIIPELAVLGQKNLSRYYSHIPQNIRITCSHAEIKQAEKGMLGFTPGGPYDRILVSAAAKAVPPELFEQLKAGGVMVIPVGGQYEIQKILRIRKKADSTFETEEYPGFMFVPLITR